MARLKLFAPKNDVKLLFNLAAISAKLDAISLNQLSTLNSQNDIHQNTLNQGLRGDDLDGLNANRRHTRLCHWA